MLQSFIMTITIIFGASIAVIAICKKLNIPPVIGFILTGLVVGPHATGLIPAPEDVRQLSELGIVFLLFMVGLDFSPERVRRLGRTMLVGGSIQASLTILVAVGIALVTPMIVSKGILFAFIVIQSSTAIVLKIYHERGESSSPHAEVSVGISLFQDLSAIILLILIPFLGMQSHMSGFDTFLSTGRNFLILIGFIVGAFFIIPQIVKIVISTGIRELVVLMALVLCLGFAGVTQKLGFSLALGAFICGILLSRSEYHTQITAEAAPFRDVFLSMFFISIGMEHQWKFAYTHIGAVALLTIAAIITKTGILFLSTKALRFPFRTAILTGVGLSNIGEFAFVIMISALPFGLLTQSEYQLLSSAAIYSMLLTPLMIGFASKLTLRFVNVSPNPSEPDRKIPEPKVIIVGFGLAGKHLASVLRSASIPYGVIECNGRIANDASSKGEPILFGDAARQDILEYSGIKSAQIIVFLISDRGALHTGIKMARILNPSIFIMCRTRRMIDIEPTLLIGADKVVSEEFETSIELFTMVLTHLHIPRNIIRSQTKVLREGGYEMLRIPAPVQGMSEKLVQILAAGTTDIFQVMENHFSESKSLRELNIRNATGVTVIAVVRSDKSITNPPADFTLQKGDALVVMGSHAQIDSAFAYLEGNKEGE